MSKLTMPVRMDRATYRAQLATFQSNPGPFLSIYLDVRAGEHRRGARLRLLANLEELGRTRETAVTAEQWAAAGETIPLIEDEDATLVALIDANGQTLAAGYPHWAGPETVTVTTRPVVGPLLAAEQALIHHVVAVVGADELSLRTTPRHGPSSRATLEMADDADITAVIQRTARISQTALLVLAAPSDRLTDLAAKTRADLPVATRLATIDLDGLDPTALASSIDASLTDHVATKNEELLALWRFHRVHAEAVDGADAVAGAIDDDRVGLLLVDHIGATAPTGRLPAGAVEELIWAMLNRDRPVHLIDGPTRELADGLGAILADRTDPDQLASLLER